MEVRLTEEFVKLLNQQRLYISQDKPKAAEIFKIEIMSLLRKIPLMPLANRKSTLFDDEYIREIIYKGYKILYRIDPKRDIAEVFLLINQQLKP